MTESSPRGFVQGTLVAEYVVERQFGAGPGGPLYLAHHGTLRQLVAVKSLSSAARNRDNASRLFRDARSLAAGKCRNIAQVLDVGTAADGSPFFVREFVEGTDLASLVAARGPLPVAQGVEYVLQALEGLRYAHVLGVSHRNIKPTNLLLEKSPSGAECIKVADFGCPDPGAGADASGFVAPEQRGGAMSIDPRTDVWAVGAVLYTLLLGKPPLEGAESICAQRADVPAALEAVVMRSLAPDPSRRYPTAAAMAEALSRFGPGTHADAAASAPQPGTTGFGSLETRINAPGPQQAIETVVSPGASAPRAAAQATLLMSGPPLHPSAAIGVDTASDLAAAGLRSRSSARFNLLAAALAVVALVLALALIWPSGDRKPVVPREARPATASSAARELEQPVAGEAEAAPAAPDAALAPVEPVSPRLAEEVRPHDSPANGPAPAGGKAPAGAKPAIAPKPKRAPPSAEDPLLSRD